MKATHIKLITALIISLLLTSCQSAWRQPFPNAEIVFQTGSIEEKKLGFVNSDGSNLTILGIGDYLRKPIWSSDNRFLFGLVNSSVPSYLGGVAAYWQENGGFKKCRKWANYIWIEESNNQANPAEMFIHNRERILLVDLSRCKVIEEIADNPGQGYVEIFGISYKPSSQKLLFGLHESIDRTDIYRIMEMDLQTHLTRELGNGINPSWAPDGSQIAYVQADGIYVMDADGGGSRHVIRDSFTYRSGDFSLLSPRPSWSPDGKWIVYHRCEQEDCRTSENTIFIAEVATGREVKVVEGGSFPDWRR